ncbi:hypothetical protein BEWA_018090 [Theileria equi strain WA]|uniref:Uncharacterized protein n=1 Tax=Theileria equi strain WA TaxID=1537102 RepID=L0AVC8_THEEQ|nr:hypothetical protein BEWA_018090 [Theileria equi strain WA]AFZ78966.1 hypothetical protein BEWA_018090 [Theileria equi strain WA]|eukprot:XP_004828632.1 hypothetical protein BEWA_018090 [Theileria equi strain WA]
MDRQVQTTVPLSDVVLPGEVVNPDASSWLQGHGIYTENNVLKASYLGKIRRVNQLIYVEPLNGRYMAQVGDIIVGTVDEISGNKWLLEVGSPERAQLSIFQVNSEDLANRRKVDEDVYEMSNSFAVNDVLACEVQRISPTGTIMLQTRTSRHGRLGNGTLVIVRPNLITRESKHIYDLDCGIRIILGCNGYIWLTSCNDGSIDTPCRENIRTLRSIILGLSSRHIKISIGILIQLLSLSEGRSTRGIRLSQRTTEELLEEFIKSRNMQNLL